MRCNEDAVSTLKFALKIALIGGIAWIVAAILGCSNQWREADADLTSEEMLQFLADVEAAHGQSLAQGSVSEALALKDDLRTSIYFADAPGVLGPVVSVTSLADFGFLGSGQNLTPFDIASVRLFFMDLPTDSGHENGLIVGIGTAGGTDTSASSSFTYYGFVGRGDVVDGEFEAILESGSEPRLVVRSFDVDDDDELMSVIQLKVYDFDQNGDERYIGKFSTLVGYGP